MTLRQAVSISRASFVPTVRDKADALKAAQTLAQLAQHVLDSSTEVDPVMVRAVVRACCPGHLSLSERMRLWEDYLAAVKQESELLDGVITWQQVDPEITATDRTQAAIDIAVEISKQALEALVGRS